MRHLIAVAAALLALGALTVPTGATAASSSPSKACSDLTFTVSGGAATYLGIRVTKLTCGEADTLLKRALRRNTTPAGWTYGNTYVKFDEATSVASCGYFLKRGKQRVTWHTDHDGGGCG
jgi:hypothetical protein